MESEMIGEGRGGADKADKAYHDITPLLCCYVLEWCSTSLTSGVAQCSWSGSSRGVWGIRVLEVEFLYNGWGMDLHVGSHMLLECDHPMNLMRYHSLPHLNLESRISLTSYSSSPSTMIGPGCRGCGHLTISSGV